MKSAKKRSKSPTRRPFTVRVWFAYDRDGERDEVRATVKVGPTMTDLAEGVMRAMRIRKWQRSAVMFSVFECSIRAVLRGQDGRTIRQAMSESIKSLAGANVEGLRTLKHFTEYFTDRNVFTSRPDQVLYHLAARSAQQKRVDGLVQAFNRLPAQHQRHLLKALRVGPAIVFRARGARGGAR